MKLFRLFSLPIHKNIVTLLRRMVKPCGRHIGKMKHCASLLIDDRI